MPSVDQKRHWHWAICLGVCAIAGVCLTWSWPRSALMALVSQGTPNGGGSGGNSKPVPVVIFKLPRTGSSWFTQELNNMATVFISKEILQRGDHGRYSAAEIEAQLIQALTAPTGKMSSKNRWSPDGRFVEDYLAHKTLKPFRTLDVVGFSVNPEHCREIQWANVLKAVPDMKIIQFMRTNVVKMAVSGYRGRQTHDACGESNLKTTVAQKVGLGQNCALPATVNWTVSEFASEVGTWQQRADAFNDFVAGDGAAQALRAVPTLLVPYEDMQIDADVTFQKIFSFLGRSHAYASHVARGGRTSNGGGWTKRTPEDLSQLLTSFRDIETALAAADGAGAGAGTGASKPIAAAAGNVSEGCACWRHQLVAASPRVFPRCTRPIRAKSGGDRDRDGCLHA